MKIFNNILDKSKRECCGCGVCNLVCEENALSLIKDKDGFFITELNENLCLNCGKCKTVCYKYENTFNFIKHKNIFMAYSKDKKNRFLSSSGGIATELFRKLIDKGYKIVGAELILAEKKLVHNIIKNKADLHKIRGSKYIPSHFHNIFEELEEESKYAVIGTPCQIAGLKKYLENKNLLKNFILIDLRCFGHVGYNLFYKYISYLNTVNSSGIKSIDLRDKSINWKMWGVKVKFNDNNIYFRNKFIDLFCIGFRSGYAVHDVCLSCDEMKNKSCADIRLEDGWSFVNNIDESIRKKGISQVTIYSEKGKEIFDSIKDKIIHYEKEYDILNRSWYSIKNDGYLLKLLRTKFGLRMIILLFLIHLTLDKKKNWMKNYFYSTNLGRYYKNYILFLKRKFNFL